jgi:hypothetical protein
MVIVGARCLGGGGKEDFDGVELEREEMIWCRVRGGIGGEEMTLKS